MQVRLFERGKRNKGVKCILERRIKLHVEFEKIRIRWFLLIDETTLPKQIQETEQLVYSSIFVKGGSLGFTDV